jgi:hypothetical protein
MQIALIGGGRAMTVSVHNPDNYMASLRQIIGQGRKRVGLLIGAGAPAGIPNPSGTGPLIPAIAGLTDLVVNSLRPTYGPTLSAVSAELKNPNIEEILSRVRSLSNVIGKTPVHGLDADGYDALGKAICDEIGKVVNRELPEGSNAYVDLVNWINGVDRTYPVEIFTTNYDLLFEQALEQSKVPFFDGFSGAREPFFDPASVSGNDLPSRWVRIWKLHGSLGWKANLKGEVIRTGEVSATHLVFPEHLKYDQTQKAPYAALFDRLRVFLTQPDTLLITTGFSFADAHVSAIIHECLAANASASVFAFQFKLLEDESCAAAIATRHSNMSVYAADKAVINGVAANWQPGDLPTKDWSPIRATYWSSDTAGEPARFLLGRFDSLARFFAVSRTDQVFSPILPAVAASAVVASPTPAPSAAV